MKSMRIEYKFLVPFSRLEEMREAILPFVFLDEYADREANKEYTVRSIYYDTMKLDDYHDKLAGIKIRKKLRIRGYNEKNSESVVFLEIKRKYENHISKNRAPVLFTNLDELLYTCDCERLLIERKNFLNAKNDANKFLYLSKIKNCSPVTLVTYNREAFYSKHDSTLRITFDKNLRSKPLPQTSNLYDEDGLKFAMPGNFILEIKFYSGFPQWMQKILKRFELNRRAISKYTTCVDNHHELNRFVDKRGLLVPSHFTGSKIQYWKEVVKNAE